MIKSSTSNVTKLKWPLLAMGYTLFWSMAFFFLPMLLKSWYIFSVVAYLPVVDSFYCYRFQLKAGSVSFSFHHILCCLHCGYHCYSPHFLTFITFIILRHFSCSFTCLLFAFLFCAVLFWLSIPPLEYKFTKSGICIYLLLCVCNFVFAN